MKPTAWIQSRIDSLTRKVFLKLGQRYVKRYPSEAVFWFCMSPFVLGCAHAVVRLGVADALADGTQTLQSLAERTDTKPDFLYRILRSLARVGLLEQKDGPAFALTAAGQRLRADHPQSLSDFVRAVTETYQPACAEIHQTLKTGTSPMEHAHGLSLWAYYAQHPEKGVVFDGWMAAFTARQAQSILDVYDFSVYGTLADIGGGKGALIAALLKAHPGMKGMLYDQESVVRQAPEALRSAGVENRCTVEAGNFLERAPEGADAYIVKHVFHDWDDDHVLKVLSGIRKAIDRRAEARLLIVEGLVEHHWSKGETLREWCDIAQMVWTSGRERTADEYRVLLQQTGFDIQRIVPTRLGDVMVLEARPV